MTANTCEKSIPKDCQNCPGSKNRYRLCPAYQDYLNEKSANQRYQPPQTTGRHINQKPTNPVLGVAHRKG